MIVAGHVQEERRNVNQTVDPIENATVSGNQTSHILRPDVTLDHADREIAELSPDADDQSGQD